MRKYFISYVFNGDTAFGNDIIEEHPLQWLKSVKENYSALNYHLLFWHTIDEDISMQYEDEEVIRNNFYSLEID